MYVRSMGLYTTIGANTSGFTLQMYVRSMGLYTYSPNKRQ
ncbi:hypothetical protein L965_584 [Leuconostoc pseudomesenteroides PS12]|nr:hypothetical protein L965_584 [Leuconostoc pseudomesenteroides PS12]